MIETETSKILRMYFASNVFFKTLFEKANDAKVIIDPVSKNYRIEVGAPPTSALILKEIGAQKGAKNKEESPGNITLEQLKNVAKAKDKKLYGTSLKEKVKQVIGTCKSMNISVEGMNAVEAMKKIDSGELKV